MSTSAHRTIAVLFGGPSPEHDVSIVTGLQAMDALDSRRFHPIPVYITQGGAAVIGDGLREEGFYIPSADALSACEEVRFVRGGLQSAAEPAAITKLDAAILALHGGPGEDGRIASLLDWAGVPYAGMRSGAAALCMDKPKSKAWALGQGIPILPYRVIRKPAKGLLVPQDALEAALAGLSFPVIVKPAHLGSSIGVAKAADVGQVRSLLIPLFKLDDEAIIEPFVAPLVEYNIAVRRGPDGITQTSAIERPLSHAELLDFQEKYQANAGGGLKQSGMTQQGMLALTRDINPDLPEAQERALREFAVRFFDSLGGTGAPRLDFISNGATGEIWFNEVNPTPGSLGFFLWEAAHKPVLYPELLSDLIGEALAIAERAGATALAPPTDARLFPRR